MSIQNPNQLHTETDTNINANQNQTLSPTEKLSSQGNLSEKQRLSRLQNEIGSKVLTLVGFESRNKDIVNSSFEKAKKQKEKLPGKNNERKNFAYLSRLDNMIEKHGDALEQKLWAASAENLVMDYDDIPDAYWKQQEQILRDNGQGRELSSREKEILAEDLIDKQRESIASWANYLGDKDCPYPTWFKVYAFDGISKMSNTLDLDNTEYNRRDRTTALSFPKLNAEILAKVYRQINDFYGVSKENWLSKHSDDEKLVSLVKSANFPKLYAKELVETKVIFKTPERTEDIHGDWFEYKLGDEEEIASLAEGTRWCIVDPNVAHNYLSYGNYTGNDNDREENEDWEDEEEDDNYLEENENNPEEDNQNSSKARFIIFRLEDPNSPGIFASNGSASIRLDLDGKVAEISGLKDGQAVEDSLVPIVREKALSLPGGEKFLQKFEDKQTLIKLDHKLQNGEDLTKEELSFLYELDHPIATLDTYNREDPRIPELKEKYGIEYALEKRVDANKLVARLDSDDIIKNLDPLLRNGADANNVVNKMGSYDIARKLDTLLEHGADINIDELISNLHHSEVADNLNVLLKNNADVNRIVRIVEPYIIVDNLDTLLKHGANIDNIVNNIWPDYVAENLEALLGYGADINNIVNRIDPYQVVNKLDFLLGHGANINIKELVSKLYTTNIVYNLDSLLRHGADINVNKLVARLDSYDIVDNLDSLLRHGAEIDVNKLVSSLNSYSYYIAKNLDSLLRHGADANNIIDNMGSYDIAHNLDTLLKYGADINNIVNKLKPNNIVDNLDSLLRHGAEIDVNKLVSSLNSYSYYIAKNLDSLLRHGADANNVIKKLNEEDIEDNIELLRKYGAKL